MCMCALYLCVPVFYQQRVDFLGRKDILDGPQKFKGQFEGYCMGLRPLLWSMLWS